MKSLIFVGLVAVASAHFHPVNEHIINKIKSKTTAWTPMEIEANPLHHKTIEQVLGLLGTHTDDDDTTTPLLTVPHGYKADAAFDSRTKWGNWVHAIRDQASCGSCWAFGATEAFTDRLAIYSKGAIDVVTSPQDLVSCSTANFGCGGGYLLTAWQYLQN